MTNTIPPAGTTPRESRFDILFGPVQPGPVRAKNRFFQVPHCTEWDTGINRPSGGHREFAA